MNWLDFGLGTSSVLLAVVAVTSQIEHWQRKEYRLDRMKAFLLSEALTNGTIMIGAAVILLNSISLLAWLSAKPEAAYTAAGLSVVMLAWWYGSRAMVRGIFRPQPTAKAVTALIVAATSAALTSVILYTYVASSALSFSFALTLTPLSSTAAVALVNVPFAWRKRALLAAAKKVRRKVDCSVVGITGSFGKTSTKFFLHHLLRVAGQNVLATRLHRNSAVAVAQDMLLQLPQRPSVYIAEMGAYRRGEIQQLARLTNPRVAILTTIHNQHTALFGSLEDIAEAKWELVEELPANGVAVLNADDPIQQERAKKIHTQIVWYSLAMPADVSLQNIEVGPTSVKGLFAIGNERRMVTIPVLGRGMVGSAVAAAAGAFALGVSFDHIASQLQTLPPIARTMELRVGKHGSTVIDDSYSANVEGVIAALTHTKRFGAKHVIIVIAPLLELGGQAAAAHERIGAALARTQGRVIIFGRLYEHHLKRGFGQATPPLTVVTEPRNFGRLGLLLNHETVVLLEGRLPDVVRQVFLETLH